MPLNITVHVNDRFIKQYRIGREEGGTELDDINTYRILEFEAGDGDQLWTMGDKFEHRYGDGVDVCILKGLQALLATPSSSEPKNSFGGLRAYSSPEKTYVEPESGG